MEVLKDREVPVLLMRSPIDVAPKVAENGHNTVPTQRSRNRRSRNEIRRIQVTVVDARVNIAARQTRANRTAWCELRPGSCGFKSAADERCAGCRIDDRKRRAGLVDRYAADGPSAQKRFLQAIGALEEGQFIPVADDKTM